MGGPPHMRAKVMPLEIIAKVRQHGYVGQDSAVRKVCTAAAHHYNARLDPAAAVEQANGMIIGPTGSGKSYLMSTIGKVLGCDYVHVDATEFTEAGYVGLSVENIVQRVVVDETEDVATIQQRIEDAFYYIDELDKKATSKEYGGIDVSRKGFQSALLKLVDNRTIALEIPSRRERNATIPVTVNTAKMSFWAGGAFSGIEDIVRQRRSVRKTVGFKSQNAQGSDGQYAFHYGDVTKEDLIHYGLLPELVHRFPLLVTLEELSRDELLVVLEGDNSPLKACMKNMKLYGKTVGFNLDCMDYIVGEAVRTHGGARSLHGMQTILREFETWIPSLPEKEFIFTQEMLAHPHKFLPDLETRALEHHQKQQENLERERKKTKAAVVMDTRDFTSEEKTPPMGFAIGGTDLLGQEPARGDLSLVLLYGEVNYDVYRNEVGMQRTYINEDQSSPLKEVYYDFVYPDDQSLQLVYSLGGKEATVVFDLEGDRRKAVITGHHSQQLIDRAAEDFTQAYKFINPMEKRIDFQLSLDRVRQILKRAKLFDDEPE